MLFYSVFLFPDFSSAPLKCECIVIYSSVINAILMCSFLQDKVAQTACMSSCKHIAQSLMNFLMDGDVKQITMGALQQFNLDLLQCECKYRYRDVQTWY